MAHTSLIAVVGRNIRELRIKAGMKGETLAKAIGVSKSTISLLENGKSDINLSTLFKLSKALDADICTLVTDKRVQTIEGLKKIGDGRTVLIDVNVVEELIDRINALSANTKSGHVR